MVSLDLGLVVEYEPFHLSPHNVFSCKAIYTCSQAPLWLCLVHTCVYRCARAGTGMVSVVIVENGPFNLLLCFSVSSSGHAS